MNDKVFIIIPAFNEAEVIAATLKDIIQLSYSVVVVDDASTDNTQLIIKKFLFIISGIR